MIPLPPFLAKAWVAVAVHLWQTTLVLLPIFLLSRWMRSAPARVVHALWSLALLKVLLPISLFTDLAGRLAILPPTAASSGGDGFGGMMLGAVSAVLRPEGFVDLLRGRLAGGLAILPAALTLLWAIGVGLAMGRIARHAAVGTGETPVPLEHAAVEDRAGLARALRGTQIPRECIRLGQSSALPHVVGWLRPRVVVPSSLVACLRPSELRAILLHEDLHRRRRDPLRGLVLQVLGALFFFYPLVRILLRRLQDATELVCDERVVRSGIGGEAYARALARTLQIGLFPTMQPFAAGVGGGSLLRVRFERISTPWRFSIMMRHRIIVGATCLLVLAGAFVPTPLVAGDASKDSTKRKANTAPAKEFLPLDKMPELVKQVPPVYPEQEKKDGVAGEVLLKLYVSVKGSVDSLMVTKGVQGHPAFEASAMVAARQWTFKPGEVGGNPVACWIQVPVNFRLQ
jgi:TonB family protein